jgi:phosphopantetheine adenylyltransferase
MITEEQRKLLEEHRKLLEEHRKLLEEEYANESIEVSEHNNLVIKFSMECNSPCFIKGLQSKFDFTRRGLVMHIIENTDDFANSFNKWKKQYFKEMNKQQKCKFNVLV